MKAELNTILELLGRADVVPPDISSIAPEKSQDPLDAVAHEYNVASFIASYGEKRKDAAKKKLLETLGASPRKLLEDTKALVKANEISDTVELAVSENHSVSAQVKIGATYLDEAGLRVELMKKMKAEDVEALFNRHRIRREPSVTYVVGERR